MNVNYELYKSFHAVARLGTLSRASEDLFITQSAISQNIKNLENQLDTTLFERTKKGMILTLQGQKLYSYISEGIKCFENVSRNINEIRSADINKTINIYSDYTIAKYFLLDKLKYDVDIDYNFKTGIENKDRFKALSEGALDLVVYKHFYEKMPSEFQYNKIGELNYSFFAQKNYDLPPKITKQQLINCNIIAKNYGTRTGINLSNKIIGNIKYKCSVDDMVVNLTQKGLGIGIAPKEYLDLSKVKIIEVENMVLPKASIFLVTKPNFDISKFIMFK